jgi:hypothetical protein
MQESPATPLPLRSVDERPDLRLIRWFAGVIGAVVGIGVGFHFGDHYYRHAFGGWEVGAKTAGIAIGSGLATAVITTVSLLVLVALLSALVGGSTQITGARARRFVIGAVVYLLILSGVLAGIGGGWAYYSADHDLFAAVLVGLASAIGAWLVAALLSLAVEIANSLRTIAAATGVANGRSWHTED